MPLAALQTNPDLHLRRVLRVQIDDMIEADHVFTMLMGDDVEPRVRRDECAARCEY